MVSNDGKIWSKRHYYAYDKKFGCHMTYVEGKSAFTNDVDDSEYWRFCEPYKDGK